MTTLVETSDDDLFLSVAGFMADLDAGEARTELADTPAKRFVADCEGLLENGNWKELLGRLLEKTPVALTKAADKDAESCILVVSNIVSKLSPQEALEAASQIAKTILAAPVDKLLQLRLLFNLFNLTAESRVKYTIFMNILQVATASQNPEVMAPSCKRVDAYVKEWGLSAAETSALYLAYGNLLKDYAPAAKDYFNLLVKYLTSVQGDAAVSARDEAVRAAIQFIAAPDLFQCDLLDMPAIRQLHNDPKSGSVFQLLSIMLTGRLNDYMAFVKTSPKAVGEMGLSHDDCVNKMRLLSLAAIGAETTSGEIPYSLVKTTLQVSDEEVESWIVKAIGMKLIEAKMDQLRELVVISRCTHRVFGEAQWTELKTKLAGWKSNVGDVKKMVGNTRAAVQTA